MTAKTNTPAGSSADREILTERVYDAPRERVFDAFTDPKKLAQWWGPEGFTTTTSEFALRPGGIWRLVMHGPDGRDYKNRINFKEVTPPARIVFVHGGDDDAEPSTHQTIVTLEDIGGGKTKLSLRLVFESAAERDRIARDYGAVEGGKQTLARLETYLTAAGSFVIERAFDASRERVWKAWTDPDQLKQWFGPKGATMPTCRMDLRPGGIFHYSMRTAEGFEMWGKWIFREILPPEKMVLIMSSSDKDGGVSRHPMSPTWPRQTLSTMTLSERDGKTTVKIVWTPYDATAEERKTFDDAHPSMNQGWGGTFEQLRAFLTSR